MYHLNEKGLSTIGKVESCSEISISFNLYWAVSSTVILLHFFCYPLLKVWSRKINFAAQLKFWFNAWACVNPFLYLLFRHWPTIQVRILGEYAWGERWALLMNLGYKFPRMDHILIARIWSMTILWPTASQTFWLSSLSPVLYTSSQFSSSGIVFLTFKIRCHWVGLYIQQFRVTPKNKKTHFRVLVMATINFRLIVTKSLLLFPRKESWFKFF